MGSTAGSSTAGRGPKPFSAMVVYQLHQTDSDASTIRLVKLAEHRRRGVLSPPQSVERPVVELTRTPFPLEWSTLHSAYEMPTRFSLASHISSTFYFITVSSLRSLHHPEPNMAGVSVGSTAGSSTAGGGAKPSSAMVVYQLHQTDSDTCTIRLVKLAKHRRRGVLAPPQSVERPVVELTRTPFPLEWST